MTHLCAIWRVVLAWDALMEEEGFRGLSKQVAMLLMCGEEVVETAVQRGIHLTIH